MKHTKIINEQNQKKRGEKTGIMPLTIKQTNTKIGIETLKGSYSVKTTYSKLLQKSARPFVNIHTEMPKIQIDQYRAFASAGLKNNIDRAMEISQNAYNSVMEYIARTAEDGDRLAQIEIKGNPILDIAERDAYTEHEYVYGYIPEVGPDITVKEGVVEIEPDRTWEGTNNGVKGEYIPGSVEISYIPDRIKIYIRQYASIMIEYTENKYDILIGI